ncbi:hypothetical protein HNR74_003380 [Flammeovirga kamogawensis]|nr:hypothetical protein [Flammeovirga kamogawensis]
MESILLPSVLTIFITLMCVVSASEMYKIFRD